MNPPSTGGIGIRRQPNQLVPDTNTQMITANGGLIHNPLPFAVDLMAVGATFYDSAGIAVSFGWMPTEVTVNPGGQMAVTVSGHLRPGIVRAALSISARRTADPQAAITTFDNYFIDSFSSRFLADIAWLADRGITSGCAALRFCPDGLVTRGQMATFLVRALGLPTTSTDYFTDDESSIHEANINRLRAAGITAGCGGSRFCPDGLVTRAQMATFLVRGFHLPPASTDYFSDDNTNLHQARINALRAAGVTSGCGGTNYCPNGIVTRGQMAAFLHRASE